MSKQFHLHYKMYESGSLPKPLRVIFNQCTVQSQDLNRHRQSVRKCACKTIFNSILLFSAVSLSILY